MQRSLEVRRRGGAGQDEQSSVGLSRLKDLLLGVIGETAQLPRASTVNIVKDIYRQQARALRQVQSKY